jgi:hypothetical protein
MLLLLLLLTRKKLAYLQGYESNACIKLAAVQSHIKSEEQH